MAGYVGNIPVPQGTQTRQSFTATASQTSFPTIGYTAGFIDVYLNGIKLVSGTDFTASNGSDVVLTTGAAVNDVLDVVIFDTFDTSSGNFNNSTFTSSTLKSNVTLKNDTEQDTDGGRASKIIYQGEQSGGEISTLAEIEASHDGTADDEKGKLIFRVNDGNDGASPTLSTEITSDGGVHIKPELQSPLIVENPATNSQGAYIKIRDGNSTAGQHTWLGRSTHDTYLYANNNDLGIKITGGSSGAGIVTMPNQPSFLVVPSSSQNNISVASNNTIAFGTERFDVGGNFSSNTFTAPVTGKYNLNLQLRLENVDTAANYYHFHIQTSNRGYPAIIAPAFSADPPYWDINISTIADMDANDTSHVTIYQSGGSAQTDISTDSFFSGILVG